MTTQNYGIRSVKIGDSIVYPIMAVHSSPHVVGELIETFDREGNKTVHLRGAHNYEEPLLAVMSELDAAGNRVITLSLGVFDGSASRIEIIKVSRYNHNSTILEKLLNTPTMYMVDVMMYLIETGDLRCDLNSSKLVPDAPL